MSTGALLNYILGPDLYFGHQIHSSDEFSRLIKMEKLEILCADF